jgi:hypothetical protein
MHYTRDHVEQIAAYMDREMAPHGHPHVEVMNYVYINVWSNDDHLEHLKKIGISYTDSKETLELYLDLLTGPIKEHPLYINHPHWIIRVIAMWRLAHPDVDGS